MRMFVRNRREISAPYRNIPRDGDDRFSIRSAGAAPFVVGNEPQAADLAVMQLAGRGDIVVTQDWGLAALVMGKGAKAISPRGMIYEEDKMDFMLEERHFKAQFRRQGGRTKGPAAWSLDDSKRFQRNLERMLQLS